MGRRQHHEGSSRLRRLAANSAIRDDDPIVESVLREAVVVDRTTWGSGGLAGYSSAM